MVAYIFVFVQFYVSVAPYHELLHFIMLKKREGRRGQRKKEMGERGQRWERGETRERRERERETPKFW